MTQECAHLAALRTEGRFAPKDGQALAHVAPAEHDADELGEGRGPCGAVRVHVEHADEEHVEDDVEHGREQHVEEGRFRVAEGPDDGGLQIVEEVAGDGEEGDEEVEPGLVHDLLRRVHPTEDAAAEEAADEAHRRGDDAARKQAVAKERAHALLIARPETLCHGNAEAARRADAEAQDEKQHAGGGTHAGQSVHAQKTANDGGVHQHVALLQHVAQHQGQGEGEDESGGGPAGHFLNHVCRCNGGKSPVCRSR